MEHKLKPGAESFTVVDGPFAGRTFDPGRAYGEIPLQEAHRFEEIKEEAGTDDRASFKPAKADKSKAAVGVAAENSEVQ